MTRTHSNREAWRPSFPTLETQVSGLVANARISFSLTTVERACERGEWSRALGEVDSLAAKLASMDAPRAAWVELCSAAATLGVLAGELRLAAAVLETHGKRAWPASRRAEMPWELAETFEEAERRGLFSAGRELGEHVGTLFPRCPIGAFAAGHFAELGLADGSSPEADVAEFAERFEEAARLADELEMAETAARARLRAGTLLLRSGAARERGRALLRDLKATELPRDESLWYGVGMAHSPFWLDRVRAADAVLATVPQHNGDAPAPRDVRAAMDYLLEVAPLELQPLEADRLEGLVDEVGGADAAFGLRSHLESVAAAPVTRADEAADILASYHGDDATDGERASVIFYRAVARLFESENGVALDATTLARIEDDFPVAAAVLRALVRAISQDAAKLATALGDLERIFRQRGAALTRAEIKPTALLWPRLLPFLETLRDDDDIDATTVRRIEASTTDVLQRWIPLAPPPSYGWWALAANLLAADLHDQAGLCARRAIEDGEKVDDDLEERVLAALLDRAMQHGDPETMLEWLEIAEARFS